MLGFISAIQDPREWHQRLLVQIMSSDEQNDAQKNWTSPILNCDVGAELLSNRVLVSVAFVFHVEAKLTLFLKFSVKQLKWTSSDCKLWLTHHSTDSTSSFYWFETFLQSWSSWSNESTVQQTWGGSALSRQMTGSVYAGSSQTWMLELTLVPLSFWCILLTFSTFCAFNNCFPPSLSGLSFLWQDMRSPECSNFLVSLAVVIHGLFF